MMADKSTKKVSLSTSLQGKDKKYSNHLKSNSTANVSWPSFTLCFGIGIGIVFHTRRKGKELLVLRFIVFITNTTYPLRNFYLDLGRDKTLLPTITLCYHRKILRPFRSTKCLLIGGPFMYLN